MLKTSCYLVFLVVVFQASSLDLTNLNLSYQYNVNDILECNSRVVTQGKGLTVYFELKGKNLQRWSLSMLMQESYASKGHDTVDVLSVDTLFTGDEVIKLKKSIPNPEMPLLIIVCEDQQAGTQRFYDVNIKSPLGFPSFLPVDKNGLPILTKYITEEDVFISPGDNSYHIYRYSDDFGPADPPMGIMKAIAPTLKIDSSYYVEGKLDSLQPYHFYLIQEDTFAEIGVTLLKCPYYYPDFKKLEELIGPLTYITTMNENKSLNTEVTKNTFEDFWINTYNTKIRAKTAIRNFYDRVERANDLFTDYKQGWKTDRGMIYIVFGPPNEVIRSERTELWLYQDGAEFEFLRISTLFTSSLYSLRRDRKYEKMWYQKVGDIRNGK